MVIRVKLFAMLRQQAGWRERSLHVSEGSTAADAWRLLTDEFPVLLGATASVRFALNGAYSGPADRLHEGDELAVIPPVAGGAQGLRWLAISPDPLDARLLADLRAKVPTSADGALVLFVGQTRDSPGTPAPGQEEAARDVHGQAVEALDYEAFDEMALTILDAIAREIEQRFGVTRLAIIHRTGRVAMGEASVVICAAAPHRAAAFEAARYAIEELKARAPIWKSELFADGSVWLGTPARTGPPAEEAAT